MADDPYAQYADPYAQYAASQQPAAPQQAPLTFSDYAKSYGKELGSAFIRPVAKGVAALPLMAMDAGIGARNLIGDAYNKAVGNPATPDYDSATSMFNQSLDQYTQASTTTTGKLAEGASTLLAGAGAPAAAARLGMPLLANALGGPQATSSLGQFTSNATLVPSNFVSNPSNLTPAQQAAAENGSALGMKLTPGMRTGSKPLLQLEAKLESSPWTSGPAEDLRQNNQNILDSLVSSTIGEKNKPDSATLGAAYERLGQNFDKFRDASRVSIVDPTATRNVVDQVDNDFAGLVNGKVSDNALVKRLVSLTDSGSVNNEQLGSLSSKLGKLAYKQMSTPSGDRDLGQAIYQIKDHVDDLVGASLSPEEQTAYAATRQQYKNLMTLVSRTNIVNPSTGNVNPVALANKLQSADKSGFTFGKNQSDLYNAVRFGQAFKPVVGNSGTATRQLGAADIAAGVYGLPLNVLSRAYYGLLSGGPKAASAGATQLPKVFGALSAADYILQ
jgi:hypothetical protein